MTADQIERLSRRSSSREIKRESLSPISDELLGERFQVKMEQGSVTIEDVASQSERRTNKKPLPRRQAYYLRSRRICAIRL